MCDMNVLLSLHIVVITIVLMAMALPGQSSASPRPLNVLLIAVDDLRPVGQFFGETEVLMPHLDHLAARSAVFTRAYCQSPTCGVSRSSLLTGRRPDTTYVLQNDGCPFTSAPSHTNWRSLPEYFRQAGYRTAGHGKDSCVCVV